MWGSFNQRQMGLDRRPLHPARLRRVQYQPLPDRGLPGRQRQGHSSDQVVVVKSLEFESIGHQQYVIR